MVKLGMWIFWMINSRKDIETLCYKSHYDTTMKRTCGHENFDSKGIFLIRSFYMSLCQHEEDNTTAHHPHARSILNYHHHHHPLPKLKIFMWCVCLDVLPIMSTLFNKWVVASNMCLLCKQRLEVVSHTLLEYWEAATIWVKLGMSSTMGDHQVFMSRWAEKCYTMSREKLAKIWNIKQHGVMPKPPTPKMDPPY